MNYVYAYVCIAQGKYSVQIYSISFEPPKEIRKNTAKSKKVG